MTSAIVVIGVILVVSLVAGRVFRANSEEYYHYRARVCPHCGHAVSVVYHVGDGGQYHTIDVIKLDDQEEHEEMGGLYD